MQIQFDNRQRKYPVNEARQLVLQVFAQIMTTEPFGKISQRQGFEPAIQVAFIGSAAMRRTNAATRSIDRVTDVLSFPMLDLVDGRLEVPLTAADFDRTTPQPTVFLGDLLICLERAQQQADEYGHSFEREVGFLAAHGLLHLLGYDHDTPLREQMMQKRQRRALSALGLTRPSK